LANGKLIWQISPYIVGKFHLRKILVKLNGEFFTKKSDFLLGAQRLVKLTPSVGWSDEVDQG